MTCVAVVGAGVAGLCSAYYLRRGGADVTVLEARRIGAGASYGNAGWVTPAQAGPLAEPGLIGYGMRSLFTSASPLYFDPRYAARMVRWLVGFARHCNRRDYEDGVIALAGLGSRCFELMDGLAADGVAAEITRTPLLGLAEDPEHVEDFLQSIAPLASLGFDVPQSVLGADEIHALEPAITGPVASGFVLSQNAVVESMVFISALSRRLREMGVEIREGAEVRDVEWSGPRALVLRTSGGPIRADSVVLAAGAWLAPLARIFGGRLPIEAGKGYSFEVRPRTMPRHALMPLESHLACSPLPGRLRVAGTMEFSGINGRLDPRRLDVMMKGARRLLGGWESLDAGSVWCGLRPVAPDGLPIIDRLPGRDNVFVAGGYSMLGMTLAAPAGERLAEFVLSGRRPEVLEPFGASRFAPRAIRRRTGS